MDSIKVKGTVLSIEPVLEKGNFKKQEIVVKTDDKYPQTFLIEFLKEKIELVEFISVEEEITVHCNLRGREWVNGEGVSKYFLSLNGWKIDK